MSRAQSKVPKKKVEPELIEFASPLVEPVKVNREKTLDELSYEEKQFIDKLIYDTKALNLRVELTFTDFIADVLVNTYRKVRLGVSDPLLQNLTVQTVLSELLNAHCNDVEVCKYRPKFEFIVKNIHDIMVMLRKVGEKGFEKEVKKVKKMKKGFRFSFTRTDPALEEAQEILGIYL